MFSIKFILTNKNYYFFNKNMSSIEDNNSNNEKKCNLITFGNLDLAFILDLQQKDIDDYNAIEGNDNNFDGIINNMPEDAPSESTLKKAKEYEKLIEKKDEVVKVAKPHKQDIGEIVR